MRAFYLFLRKVDCNVGNLKVCITSKSGEKRSIHITLQYYNYYAVAHQVTKLYLPTRLHQPTRQQTVKQCTRHYYSVPWCEIPGFYSHSKHFLNETWKRIDLTRASLLFFLILLYSLLYPPFLLLASCHTAKLWSLFVSVWRWWRRRRGHNLTSSSKLIIMSSPVYYVFRLIKEVLLFYDLLTTNPYTTTLSSRQAQCIRFCRSTHSRTLYSLLHVFLLAAPFYPEAVMKSVCV